MSTPPVKAGLAASIVGVICLYELVVHAVNAFLETEMMPSVTHIAPPTVRGAARRLSPRWMRYGALMLFGLVFGEITRRRQLPPAAAAAAATVAAATPAT
jgi:hypothetical protein